MAPWWGRNPTAVREIDGKPIPEPKHFMESPARRVVSPRYFSTLDIAVTRGRVFTRDETSSARTTIPAVISESMARRFWPGQDAIGHQFRVTKIHEVIGVCRDVQSVSFMQDDGPFYYWPLDLQQAKPGYLLVRVSGDTQTVSASVGEIVRQADPQMATTIRTLASTVQRQGEQLKPMMIYGAISGVLALLLALTGVYAVVSFSVSQRIREIGIRTALGAQRRDVVALVLRSGASPVIGGLLAGVGLVFALSALMASMLYGVNPRDPLTLAIVPLLLLAAALGAIWIPARRAAALDPLSSLRHD